MRMISLKGRPLGYSKAHQCYVRTLSTFDILNRITYFFLKEFQIQPVSFTRLWTQKPDLYKKNLDQDVIYYLEYN